MVYRDPQKTTTALDEINDLAGEYWDRNDQVAQDIYNSVAHELAQKLRAAGQHEAANLIDPGEPRRAPGWPECMCTPSGECGNCWENRQRETT